jgi:hypothetical protein
LTQTVDHSTPEGPADDAATVAMKRDRRNRLRARPHPMAFAYTIADAQSMGAPSRTKIYQLAKLGKLTLVRGCGRTLVSGDSLRALLGVTP